MKIRAICGFCGFILDSLLLASATSFDFGVMLFIRNLCLPYYIIGLIAVHLEVIT